MYSLENHQENLAYEIQENLEQSLVSALDQENFQLVADIIKNSHNAEIADFINKATYHQQSTILSILTIERLKLVIVELDHNIIPSIIEMISLSKTAAIIAKLDIDDAIYVLDSLDENLKQEIFTYLDTDVKKNLTDGFSYPEGSAGRLMQRKFVAVSENSTIKLAIDQLRKQNEIDHVFYEIFVVNKKNIPIGSVPISNIVVGNDKELISKIMKSEVKSVSTDLDEDEISYVFKKYGYVTVPVVNKFNRLVGVITIDDVMEVIDKSAEENTMHMGGVREDDMHLSVLNIIKSRFPWLLISLITATLCSLVVNFFQDTIKEIVILSAIMPIVAGISGNAGTQTMTVTVLSLADKEITTLNITRVIFKQIISCSLNGLFLALVGGVILNLLHGNYNLSFVFGLSVTINFALAGFFGSIIPIIFDKFGFDPAVSAPVFVTTITDILSFAIFLGLAAKLLIH